MSESPDSSKLTDQSSAQSLSKNRRDFLKKASKIAVTAPAVTLILAASAKPREAHAKMYEGPPGWWI